MMGISWAITGLAIVLLAVASWLDKTHPGIRAVLTTAASICLGCALTGNPWMLAPQALDVILVTFGAR